MSRCCYIGLHGGTYPTSTGVALEKARRLVALNYTESRKNNNFPLGFRAGLRKGVVKY